MDCLVCVPIANLVMENTEIKAVNFFFSPSNLWIIFVDDTLVIIESDMVQKFFAHINSIEASIEFTNKHEKEDSLPFLDMLIMKKIDGILATKIYRKKLTSTFI